MQTSCCIVGGGPAGMVLGLLLARQGVDTVVLEKHPDFFRDFRGDTIHPSTLEIMYDLGILQEFLQLPHQVAAKISGFVEEQPITVADFSKLKVQCPYIAFMPQWDFLNFIAKKAQQYPNFHLLMETEAVQLKKVDNKVVGIIANSPQGTIEIQAHLVVGADGRHSTVRECADFLVQDIGAPMDVFWLKLPRKDTDPNETFGKFSAGRIMICINRQNYWQCGFVIAKGQAEVYQQQDISNFRQEIVALMPMFADRVVLITNWDDVKLLSVKIDRLSKWYAPGLLCIGDAAHAMSPVGGVGINLAIQDAVAAANILGPSLLKGEAPEEKLRMVQERRTLPMKVIQTLQIIIQKRVIYNVLHKQKKLQLPWLVQQIQKSQLFRQFLGYIIGIGVRPEHPNSI